MNNFKYFYILIFGLLAFFESGGQQYDILMPSDFTFKITQETCSYDSKTCIYTRIYTSRASSIKVILSPEDVYKIYEAVKKNDFMSFPSFFTCSEGIKETFPSFTTTIQITYNNLQKKVSNQSGCKEKVEIEKSKGFFLIESTINRILQNKHQLKKMRKSDLIFE